MKRLFVSQLSVLQSFLPQRLLFQVSIWLLSLCASFYADAQPTTYRDAMHRANQAFNADDYDTALQLLHTAQTQANSKRDAALVNNALGWIYYNKGVILHAKLDHF